MELLKMMKTRRFIRKYRTDRVETEKLEKILEAGLFAPNPGGRQGLYYRRRINYSSIGLNMCRADAVLLFPKKIASISNLDFFIRAIMVMD